MTSPLTSSLKIKTPRHEAQDFSGPRIFRSASFSVSEELTCQLRGTEERVPRMHEVNEFALTRLGAKVKTENPGASK